MIKNYKTLIINKSNILPLVICLIFLVLQFNIIDYGTNINNIDYISNYKISDPDILEKSDTFTLADEKNIVASPSGIKESKDKWFMRFNLYTVQPEENANIKALARIKNDPKNFDPAFYAYGGAYLYSLGAWYFIIDKIGIIDIKSFHELLKVPDNMDEIYISGRFFVLLLFTLSGLVLFYTISKIANSTYASLCLILYLATPISLLYSVVLKPHFYALFWCNLSLLILCNSLNTKYLSSSMIALLGICVGMAVGSVITFSLFSLFVGFVLIFFYKRSYVSFNKLSLFIIVALATFIATNPYIIVNYEGFALERSAMKDWFFLSFEPTYLIRFIKNSILCRPEFMQSRRPSSSARGARGPTRGPATSTESRTPARAAQATSCTSRTSSSSLLTSSSTGLRSTYCIPLVDPGTFVSSEITCRIEVKISSIVCSCSSFCSLASVIRPDLSAKVIFVV